MIFLNENFLIKLNLLWKIILSSECWDDVDICRLFIFKECVILKRFVQFFRNWCCYLSQERKLIEKRPKIFNSHQGRNFSIKHCSTKKHIKVIEQLKQNSHYENELFFCLVYKQVNKDP